MLKKLLLGTVIGAATLVGMQPANATFYSFASVNGGAYFAYGTGNAGTGVSNEGTPDSTGTTASITGSGSAGGMSVLVSTFTTNAPNANGPNASFTNSTQVNLSGTGTVTFAVVDNAFQGPSQTPIDLLSQISGTFNSTTGGAASGSATISQTSCVISGSQTVTSTNVGSLCGLTGATSTTATSFTISSGSGANHNDAIVKTLTTPFTSVEYFTVTLDHANVLATGSINIASVPEPMSLALLGTGLVGLGMARRKRA